MSDHAIVPQEENHIEMIVDVKEAPEVDPEPERASSTFTSFFLWYLAKFMGVQGKKRPPRTTFLDASYNFLISFIGILLITATDRWYLSETFHTTSTSVLLLQGSFAATAVLVYDLYSSPVAQPRNVFGGHLVSSFVGVSVRLICEALVIDPWVQAPLAVALAIFFMDLTECIHPPGGATALIAVIGGPAVHNLGYAYILTCLGASFISVSFACLGNNLAPNRQYPLYWI